MSDIVSSPADRHAARYNPFHHKETGPMKPPKKKKFPRKQIVKKKPSKKKSTSLDKQIDQIFAEFDNPNSPGMALAVRQNGTVVYRHPYGMADLDHKIPIKPDTVFHAASLTKQFTAMAIRM